MRKNKYKKINIKLEIKDQTYEQEIQALQFLLNIFSNDFISPFTMGIDQQIKKIIIELDKHIEHLQKIKEQYTIKLESLTKKE